MQDEGFPPGISPYSSMNSTLQNQALDYAQRRCRRRDRAWHRVDGRRPLLAFREQGLGTFRGTVDAQPLDFKANLYGVFVQGSYRFDAF